MRLLNKQFYISAIAVIAIGSQLTACDGDTSGIPINPPPPPPEFTFEVEVINLTNFQPLSPVALIAHREGNIWTIGESSSDELELLAEGGDNSEIVSANFAIADGSGADAIGPGGRETISVTVFRDIDGLYLSSATMLVNTNDAFTGFNRLDVSAFSVGDSETLMVPAYDAGTEANSEAEGTIPGPADGGEGYDVARDDVDFVSLHNGVVTSDFGLTSSVLDESHRFDNPVAKIVVTRIE